MTNNPLLSICIPTYNRSQNLKLCLESLIKQKEFNSKNVEIVISDNCSTDDTEKIVQSYINNYDNISYYRNNENVTMENFPISLSRATGELAKLTNDTTVFEENSLRYILEIIKKYIEIRPTIFFLNSNIGNNIICNDLETFLRNVSFYTTWIGGFTLWKEDRIGIKNNLYACDTFLWQVPVLLNSVVKHGKSLIIKKKVFSIVADSEKRIAAYNNSLHTIFYKNYFFLLDEFFQKYPISFDCYEWLRKDLLVNFFTNWLILYKLQKQKPTDDVNLVQLVFNEYKNDKYFVKFIIYFNAKFLFFKIKKILKNLLVAKNTFNLFL